jgi:mannose-6-phosphate isomerase-like protein (cupin superfamily)
MAGYTRVNLDELKDMAAGGAMSPGVEARFARMPLEMEKGGLGWFRMAPGFRFPFGHTHREQEEVYVVVSGSARMKLGEEIVELATHDAVRVSPETMRGLEAGPDGAEVLVFGAPDTGNSDTEMARGWWTD